MWRRDRFTLTNFVGRLMPGRPTPKSVYALASAGTPATEIARKTGLPVDAIAMLIQLGAARSGSAMALPFAAR